MISYTSTGVLYGSYTVVSIISRHDLTIEVHYRNQPNKSVIVTSV